MNVTAVPAHLLTPEHIEAWSELQRSDSRFDSPFFHPEFTKAVASVRDDVEVAVMQSAGEMVGFFPYQRNKHNVALPVGGAMSDFQGVVARDDVEWSPRKLLLDCGLAAWHFNHLIASQAQFQRYQWRWIKAQSPYMDLSDGFEAYRAARKKSRSDLLPQAMRKSRKIEREVGPLRFVPHTTDPEVLKTLIRWKVAQYRQMKVRNYLEPKWVAALIEQLIQSNSEELGCKLSALYVGERLAAVHLFVRSGGVLHSWIPAYEEQLSRFSPGLILLLETAKAAQSLGIRRIDLGRGPEHYKTRFMSGAIPLAEGSVDLRPLAAAVRRQWFRTREIVRSSPLRAPAQSMVRNARAWLLYRGHS